jgi:hypothetical protein
MVNIDKSAVAAALARVNKEQPTKKVGRPPKPASDNTQSALEATIRQYRNEAPNLTLEQFAAFLDGLDNGAGGQFRRYHKSYLSRVLAGKQGKHGSQNWEQEDDQIIDGGVMYYGTDQLRVEPTVPFNYVAHSLDELVSLVKALKEQDPGAEYQTAMTFSVSGSHSSRKAAAKFKIINDLGTNG